MKNLKKMIRRGFTLFMALAICLSMMNITAFAEGTEGADSSGSGYSVTGSEASDETDEPDGADKPDAPDGSDGSDKTDGTDKLDGTDGTDKPDESGETDKADGSGEMDNSDGTDKSDETDKTDNPDGTDGTNQPDGSGETDKADGTDNPDGSGETDKPDGTDNPDGSGKTDKPDETDNPDGSSETDKPDGTDNSDETGKPDGADQPDKTGKPDGAQPDETGKPDGADQPDETGKPDGGVDQPDETGKPDETDQPDETGKPDEADQSGKPDETNKSDEADQPGETEQPDETSGDTNKLVVDGNDDLGTDGHIPVKILEETESLPELVESSDKVQAFLDAVADLPDEVGSGNAKKVMESLIPSCNKAYDALTDEQKAFDEVCEAKFLLAVTAVEANLRRFNFTSNNGKKYASLDEAAQEAYQAVADTKKVENAYTRLTALEEDATQLGIFFAKAEEMDALLLKSVMTEEGVEKYSVLMNAFQDAFGAVKDEGYVGVEDQFKVTTARESHINVLLAFYNAAAAVDAVLDQPMTEEGAEKYAALMSALRDAYDAVQAAENEDPKNDDTHHREYKGVTDKYDNLVACEDHIPVLLAFFNAVDAVKELKPITKENAEQCVKLVVAAQEAYKTVEAAGAANLEWVQAAFTEINGLKDLVEDLSGLITDERTLKRALDRGQNPIVLENSFTVCDTITVTNEVTLDLNGKTLTWENTKDANNSSLFRVEEGGVLTITDNSGTVGYTKDYTVMLSDSKENGTTSETTETYTATVAGGIITLRNEISTGGENLSAIIIVDGGKLIIEKGVIDGTDRKLARGVLVDNGGSVSMKGGAIVRCAARSVYGKFRYGSGIIIRNGSLSMSGGVIAENSSSNDIYRHGGGIGLRDGSLDISGGVITDNAAGVGGGIAAEGGSGSVTIGGNAVITGNSALYSGGGGIRADGSGYTVTIQDNALITMNTALGGGGGISTGSSACLKVESGKITGNEAHTGGGIDTNNLLMTGGIVARNIAFGNTDGQLDEKGNPLGNGEGGGIRVSSGMGKLTGGYITNNETRTTIDWGGGGMFVSGNAIIEIENLLVTDNKAQGLGGGVGGCSTGNVVVSATDGMASFGNIAYGNKEHGAHAIYKWEDQAALKNDDFLYYGSNDFFCAHGSYVSDAMLGGGSANWHGSQDTGTGYRGNNAEDGEIDVQQLAIPKDGAAASQFLMGLSAKPSEEDQGKAMAAAKVFITKNESSTHGGGIMCNGLMFIGAIEKQTTVFSSVPVEAKKVYKSTDGSIIDLKGGEFTFDLVEKKNFSVKNGRPSYDKAQTAFNDNTGKVLFTINDLTEEGKYTYYLVEKPGSEPVIYDSAIYRVEVEVTISQEISWGTDTKFIATVYRGKVSDITAMEINEDSQLVELPGEQSESVDHAVFTNTYTTEPPKTDPEQPDPVPEQPENPAGSLRIVKSVSGGDTAAAEKTYVFTVTGPDSYSETVSITGSGEKVLENLKPGLYHVTEADASIEGYKWEVNIPGNGDITVPEGNTGAEIAITNTYTVPDQPEPPKTNPDQPQPEPPTEQPKPPTDQPENQAGSLRIVKSVSGGDTAAAEKIYAFTVTGPDSYSETVSITGSGEAVLENLKPGLYHVTEEDASIEGYDWAVTGNGDITVSENARAEITITNTYTVRIPEEQPPRSGGGNSGSSHPRRIIDNNPIPQAEISDEQPPLNEISDEDVPLAPAPETPVAVLPPEEVPLAMRIPDEDVPLAAVPKTGDNSWIWSLLTLFSAVGLIGLELESRRKKNTEK